MVFGRDCWACIVPFCDFSSFFALRQTCHTLLDVCNGYDQFWFEWLARYGKREKLVMGGKHYNSSFCNGHPIAQSYGRERVLYRCRDRICYSKPVILQTVPLYQQVLHQIAEKKVKLYGKLVIASDNQLRAIEKTIVTTQRLLGEYKKQLAVAQNIEHNSKSDRSKKRKLKFNISNFYE